MIFRMRRDIFHLVIWITKIFKLGEFGHNFYLINGFSQLSNRFSLMSFFFLINFIISFITIFFSCKAIIADYTTLKQRKIRFIRKKKSEPLYTFGCTSSFRTSFNVSFIFTGLVRICSFGSIILIISNLYHDWRKQIFFGIKSPIFPLFSFSLKTKDCLSDHNFWSIKVTLQAPVVQTLDSAIHRINHYPGDNYWGN